jgi:DNA-binding SARP family transcriptional activator
MIRRSPLTTIRSLSAALVLSGFFVGVPILLAHFGSPLPTRVPSWSRFVTDVRVGYVPSSAAVKVALAAGWALWAFLSYEIVAEGSSWIRNHASRRSSALGPLQPVLARLVAALVLSAPVPGRGPISASSAAPFAAKIELTGSEVPTASPVPVIDPASLPTYVVQPHDTLWGIAERCLGDPLRWSEIASLNEGRPEGSSQFGDPNWIYPGWVLVLPADARGLESSTPGISSVPAVAQPDTSAQVLPPPSKSSTGSRQHSVQPREPTRPADERAVLAGGGAGSAGERPRSTDQRRPPVTPIEYGILGAGVILVLDRMRRARQRHVPQGVRISLPKGELADLERGLRSAADRPLLSSVDIGIRLLAELVANGACSWPPLVAVRCRPDLLELVMDPIPALNPPPEPFRLTSEANVWVLERDWLTDQDGDRRRELSCADTISPTLVTLGADALGTVLVDVERLGSLSISGSDAAMVLQGMVVELCTAPWADGADVVVVGHSGELRSLERARTAPSLAALVPEMQRRTAEQRLLLSNGDVTSASEGRRRYGGAGWDPVVTVCLPEAVAAEPVAAARLLELAGDGNHGVVVLVGSKGQAGLGARWSALADGGPITLSGPAGSTGLSTHLLKSETGDCGLLPQRIPTDMLNGVDALIGEAASGDGVPIASLALKVAENASVVSTGLGEEGHEVEVRVLGPVEVLGNSRPFTRAWALELVVYLAMNERATTDQWATALWPDRLMAAATIHSTASAARRSLGISAMGNDHLPRSHNRLALGPGVTSDWARLQHLAASDMEADRIAALKLVRGRPFEGLKSADWTILEGWVAAIEAVVVDLAMSQAECCLDARNPAEAEWAARQGLRISPYDERLYRLLLRAADAAGHPEGVEATMRELVQLVADEVEPYDSVHPETLELYRRLSRRAGARRGA